MRGPVASYLVALAAVATAVAIRLLLEPLLGDRIPFATLFAAILFVSWHSGRGPALLALIVGSAAVAYFVLQPRYSFAVEQIEYQVGLVMYAVVGVVSISLFDQLRKALSQVAEQAERLRTTLASIGDGVISTDTEGRITNMNAVAESLTGWTNAGAMGQPLDTVFHIVNEDTRQPVENPAMRALREGVIVGLANHTVVVAKDGTERPIDDSAAPIQCKDGEIGGCVLVFRDVTERRRAEQLTARLLDAARLVSSIVESSEDAIISKSLDGTILTWNAAAERLFGFTAEQAVGRPITLIIPAERRDEEEHILARIRAGERIEPFDIERRLNDGQLITVSVTISPVRDERGRVISASRIIRDITERRRMENELRQVAAELSDADRRKDEFLATLAHELRNPLAPIRNGLQIMRLTGNNGEAVGKTLTMMERQLGQMVHLVDDLLDVSRISRDKLELRKERVELAAVLNNAVETSRPLIEASGHELTVSLPPEPVFVDADVTRLGQVFTNLLNNAAKYSERGGRIRLAVERQGSDVVVSVKDTGVGISPDMLPKIFEMFIQVDRSLEKTQGGLGIGLTLVKRLVEMHGGSVEARSEGDGKGSEFVVRLPVVLTVFREVNPSTEKGESVCPTGQCRILVADDNQDSATSLAMILEIMGNDVRTANDGLQAVDMAATFRPDVILLDIGMPKLNGYEACRRIRQQPWGEKIVIIAQTGWGQDEDKRRSREAGFNHHLVKPVAPATLEKLLAGTKPAPV